MFVPSIGLLIRLALIVCAIYWVKEVLERLGSDIAGFRDSYNHKKAAIAFIWLVTIYIIYRVAAFAVPLFINAARVLR